MKAAIGSEVGLYFDTDDTIAIGDVITTGTGRAYGVIAVREQLRGKHAGRKHLRVVVLESAPVDGVIHLLRWYKRSRGTIES